MSLPEVRRKISENNAMKRPEVRQKHAKSMKHPEKRQKHAEAMKGENNPMYGKTHSEEAKRKMSENNPMNCPEVRRKISGENSPTKRSEVRRKISEAKRSPEYIPAREFFFSLPSDIDLKEKRRLLHKKINGVTKDTLNRWIRQWTQDA